MLTQPVEDIPPTPDRSRPRSQRKRPRGSGRVYLRGSIWWIAYNRNGHEIRESAETTNENRAWRLLSKRLEESKRPEFVGPAEKGLTVDDIERKILADYEREQKRSAETAKHCLKKVKHFFKYDRLIDITPSRIEAYQKRRLQDGAARATVNQELAYLRRGFNLLFEAREISYRPPIKLLNGNYIREGFINKADFDAIVKHLQRGIRDLVRFLYSSAWRTGEALSLQWRHVDLDAWVIRLERKNEKTNRPRTLPLVGELREIIENRIRERQPDCPFVFHRNGKPIRSFRTTFKSACQKAGMPDLVPHDLRRSAIRNFRKAGVSEIEGMRLSGHRTNSVYKRYDIVDEEDLRRSIERVQEHLKQKAEHRKVVPIRPAG